MTLIISSKIIMFMSSFSFSSDYIELYLALLFLFDFYEAILVPIELLTLSDTEIVGLLLLTVLTASLSFIPIIFFRTVSRDDKGCYFRDSFNGILNLFSEFYLISCSDYPSFFSLSSTLDNVLTFSIFSF